MAARKARALTSPAAVDVPRRVVATPLRIRAVTLRNRVVGAPMERNYCDLSGRATQQYVDYLGRRATGGAALLFTESCYVAQASKARPHQMGLHGDHVVDALSSVASAVHDGGAMLGVELNHAGRVVPSAVSQMQPVAPSAVPCTEIGGEKPRALSSGEIDEIVGQFGEAALRGVSAGADVVSVHGAHGYLIAQFLSPRSNHRDDEYGEPTRFLNRVLASVRAAIGEGVPLFLRLSAFEALPDGLDVHQSLNLTEHMDLHLVDVVDVSAGTYGAGQWITPSGEIGEGYLEDVARRYRAATGRLVSVAGRITTPAAAERVLASGAADLVVAARALHADADWARHVLDDTEPRPCIACNQGCADVIFTGMPLWCAANPDTGSEHLHLTTPVGGGGSARRLLVVGGGPAGIEAALTAAQAGVAVRLLERENRLGGQFALACELRAKPQFSRLLRWYERELRRWQVDVRTGVEATPDVLEGGGVDAVILATGGRGYVPPVPGRGLPRVAEIREWLTSGSGPASAAPVVIWGADRIGVYVADHLASRRHPVTLLGTQAELAPDAGARERLPAVRRLERASHVSIQLRTGIERVLDDGLVCVRDDERVALDAPGLLLVSQGTVPALSRPADWFVTCRSGVRVAESGEQIGGSTFDSAIRSGRSVARALCSSLTGNQKPDGPMAR